MTIKLECPDPGHITERPDRSKILACGICISLEHDFQAMPAGSGRRPQARQLGHSTAYRIVHASENL